MTLITGQGFGSTSAGFPAALQPTQGKSLYGGNYLNFLDGSIEQWAQQFLPDVYDKEIEIYGNRTISGFLKMVSAEMPSTSDQIIWLEQGRLHTRYSGLRHVASLPGNSAADATASTALTTISAGATLHFHLNNINNNTVPGTGTGGTQTQEGDGNVNFKVGQTVMIGREGATRADKTVGATIKGVISAVTQRGFTVRPYSRLTSFGGTTTSTYTALVYGSEFAKGTGNFTEKLDPSYSTYSNAPIIMKEHYAINGSDTGQIGWIEVTSENGASGYLWYVKAEHENRLRWEDYIEMAMVEGQTFATGSTGATAFSLNSFRHTTGDDAADQGIGTDGGVTAQTLTARGTEGFFQALTNRGNVWEDLAGDLAGATASTGSGIGILSSTFDNILMQLDRQGAIEENMLYTNRTLALAFDNFLAAQNSYGTAGNSSGVSWGVFNNSADMALDLGFSGFRRGSYDFYKTDWKYLNDFSTRGAFGDVQGVMIPAGTSTVYDQNLGKNIKRPFLHVRYRASETDNRKMKSWITGSVGGAYTTDVDEMRMHYLTERCLITQGANNFFMFQGA